MMVRMSSSWMFPGQPGRVQEDRSHLLDEHVSGEGGDAARPPEIRVSEPWVRTLRREAGPSACGSLSPGGVDPRRGEQEPTPAPLTPRAPSLPRAAHSARKAPGIQAVRLHQGRWLRHLPWIPKETGVSCLRILLADGVVLVETTRRSFEVLAPATQRPPL